MEPYRKRLHLDKTETIFIFGLVFLISSLMFTFGILVGFSLKPKDVEVAKNKVDDVHAGLKATMHRSPASEESHESSSGESHKEGGGESPKIAKRIPGKVLRQDYYESKQRALVDMALRETPTGEPRSILDTKAHFAANTQWKRDLASEANPAEKDPGSNEAEETEEPKDVALGVRELFERSPTSSEVFVPTPGSFTVQIASYATKDESRAKVFELRKAGFNDAYVEEVKLKNGETWWRVAVGSFPGANWAKKAGDTLKRRKLAGDFVIRQVN